VLAGVAGYAAEFLHAEVPDAAVFAPCDVAGMVAGIEQLVASREPVERQVFLEKFARSAIAKNMACDVLELAAKR
jgi:threonine dehydratase